MNLETLLEEITRPCTKLIVGGFKPTNQLEESWFGKVNLYKKEEDVPLDKNGSPMMQLAQFFLPSIDNVDSSLSEVKILTVFVSSNIEANAMHVDGNFEVREYTHNDILVSKEIAPVESNVKAFPIKTEQISADHPNWDEGGLTYGQFEAFLELEEDGVISSYFDVTSHLRDHKFGGYPSFCQSGVNLSPYKFIFQIDSDSKLGLNVFDGGSFQFWRCSETATWKLYFDFY